MARQGWSLSEREIRRIVSLLSETDLLVGAIAERMGCSKERDRVHQSAIPDPRLREPSE